MAERDCTDSPAVRVNEPTEHVDPPSPRGPGIETNRQKSQIVKLVQKEMLDKSERKKLQTSGGTAPNVDEPILCEKENLKIGDIDPSVFIGACNILNIYHLLGNDWRTLAGKLGYTVIEVQIFERKSNPAEEMLKDWNSKGYRNNLESLLEALRKMNRQDVIQLFQEEIDKKGDTCNCDDCGHLR